jgi:valyl-tRNA synthetase
VRPAGAAVSVGASADCYVMIGDERLAAEVRRLEKEREKARKDIEVVQHKLGNPEFIARAKEEVVEGEREKETDLLATMARIDEALSVLRA